MDISEIEIIAVIEWKNEDELPEWVDDEVYDTLFSSSKVINGCRMFPFITICGKEILLKQ